MPATIVMGGQWGDEGKGKLTDALASKAAVVVRANGGSNAGHTVSTDQGVFQLHLIPSGILYPDCLCVVGAGVVIDLPKLLKEMDDLQARGISLRNLFISERAHVVLPLHPLLDQLEESAREDELIGTTKTGNGPAYADKVARRGLRVADLLDERVREQVTTRILLEGNRLLSAVYGAPPLDSREVLAVLADGAERIRPFVARSESIVHEALSANRSLLIECAQGAMLDVDYGVYPFVTSSTTTAAGACQGAGVPPTAVERVVGVFKAYSTRVGGGPMPTELDDEVGQLIRERGREYGTTTGRPRRTGWFDAVSARYITRLNGVTDVAMTLLDVLDPFEEIKVCTGYELNGELIDFPPSRWQDFAAVKPVYQSLPGWQSPTVDARAASDLPAAARDYLAFLESFLEAQIALVGVGPAREQLVPLRPDLSLIAALG